MAIVEKNRGGRKRLPFPGGAASCCVLLLLLCVASSASVIVKEGDTLYKISRERLGSDKRWKEIAELNQLPEPYALKPGMTLRLPGEPAEKAPEVAPERIVPLKDTAADVALPSGDSSSLSPTADASDAPPAEPTSAQHGLPTENLDDLVSIAGERNRKILAARALVRAADARVKPAGSLEDPTLAVGYQEGMGLKDVPSIGKDPDSQFMLELEQMLPGPGKRGLRMEVARWMVKQAQADAAAVSFDIQMDVKKHYWQLFRSEAEAAILERTRENLRSLAKGVESRYSVGSAQQEDVLRAGLEISMVAERLRMLQREATTARLHINDLLDRESDHPVGRAAERPVFALPFSRDQLEKMATESCPTLQSARALIDRDNTALALAKKERGPDYGVRGGVYPRGKLDTMWSLGFSISLPIRTRERQDEWIREAEANLEASRHSYEAHRREIIAFLHEYHAMAEEAQDLIKLYDSAIIPQAQLALRSSISSYQVGKVDFMTVTSNAVTLKQYEIERVRRLSEFHIAVAELEGILGHGIMGRTER